MYNAFFFILVGLVAAIYIIFLIYTGKKVIQKVIQKVRIFPGSLMEFCYMFRRDKKSPTP